MRSSGNSQHLTDWYTFAHVLDGFAFYLALALIGSAWLPTVRLTLATALAVAWEIFENTTSSSIDDRVATIALGDRGDSIVNSVRRCPCLHSRFPARRQTAGAHVGALGTSLTAIAAWVALGDSAPMLMLVHSVSALTQ